VSAEIESSKPDGAPWDSDGSAPDPYATVTVVGAGSGVVRSSKLKDSSAPTWNESGTVAINRGDTVRATIYDKDVLGDDLIEAWAFTFAGPGTKKLPGGTSLTLKFATNR
jgi:hypothetical protein